MTARKGVISGEGQEDVSGCRHIIPVSGKAVLAAGLLQTAARPDLPYEFVYNDVGCELPETYAWLDAVEQKTGWRIVRVGKSLDALIDQYGGFLPGPKSRYCTRETKIEPFEAWLGASSAVVYYGLRADENRIGYTPLKASRIHPVYPLREFDIDLRGVFSILEAQGLLPPDFFWQRLFDAVGDALKARSGWDDILAPWERRLLFTGRTRGNCYFCFFQRRFEWVWLYETHPDLFERAVAKEKPGYSFMSDLPLVCLRSEATREAIFARRVGEVRRYILGKLQGSLFPIYADTEIAATSCGLLCGK